MIKTSKKYKVAIIGYGWVGKAYHKMFPDAVIYDEPQNLVIDPEAPPDKLFVFSTDKAREVVNSCDLALICVPTNPVTQVPTVGVQKDELDMSIVEDVISWLDTPLILCKSALQPGTVDRLVKETGKKIAVSVEMVGEGKYFVPYWKYPDAEDPTK